MGYLYLVQIVVVAGALIWGKLEWYAAVLVGLVSPIVTLVLSMLLVFVLPSRNAEQAGDQALVAAVALICVGAFVLATVLRKGGAGKKQG